MSIDPEPGFNTLGELALPPTQGENYLSQIATATTDVQAQSIRAELQVSLDLEGIYVTDDENSRISQKKRRQIQTIIKVAIEKDDSPDDDHIRRKLSVVERSR